jgi:GNAT superfamily N-acetyltransferase
LVTNLGSASAAASDIAVRRAADDEARACRLMMPETFGPTLAPDLWVAIDGATSLIAGAAAIAWRPVSSPPGFPVLFHVLPPLRRRGVGRALVEAVARACAGNASCLHAWVPVPESGPAAAFLAHTGFTTRKRLLEFEADHPRFYNSVKAVLDRRQAAGRIPARYRIVKLREVSIDEVALLVGDNFHDMHASVVAGIARGLAGYDGEKSVVLLVDGEVRGALLYAWNDGRPLVDVNVVAPELRRGAANVMLLEAAIRHAIDGGAHSIRFSCEESVIDTMNIARRAGARPSGVALSFTRMLPEDEGA